MFYFAISLIWGCFVENTTPFLGSWHYSLEFHGSVASFNIFFHCTGKVTDWLRVSLTPCFCTMHLLTMTSANCNREKQILTNVDIHFKKNSCPVPVRTQYGGRSHLPAGRMGQEQGGHCLCPLISNHHCLLPNEAPAICEHWTAKAELQNQLVHRNCQQGLEEAAEECQHIHPGGQTKLIH